MKIGLIGQRALLIGLLAAPVAFGSARAEEGSGWGPGHAMMWGGPVRNWMGWGPASHFCGETGIRNIDRFISAIKQDVRPTEGQTKLVDALREAFTTAHAQLEGLCEKPRVGRWTPVERLTSAEDHLNAMLIAIHTVKPAMVAFYYELTDEQKMKMDGLRPGWWARLPWNR